MAALRLRIILLIPLVLSFTTKQLGFASKYLFFKLISDDIGD